LRALFIDAHRHNPELHSFPTRRSSDLRYVTPEGVPGDDPQVRARDSLTPAATEPLKSWEWTPARAPTPRLSFPPPVPAWSWTRRSEEHTSELQSRSDLVCRLLHEKKKN